MKIHSMDIHAVFIVLLMLPAAVKMVDPKGGVTVWKDEVTLTCPGHGEWFKNYNDAESSNKLQDHEKQEKTFKYDGKSKYLCKYSGGTKRYQFYVEGKVCEYCFELDAYVFLGVIIVDLVVTVIVMMMIFKCTKRKDATGATQTSRAPTPAGGRPPPSSSSDYAALNPHTRSQDTYTFVNRTG